MLSVQVFFNNGSVTITEPIPAVEGYEVIVTFIKPTIKRFKSNDKILGNESIIDRSIKKVEKIFGDFPKDKNTMEKVISAEKLIGIAENNVMTFDELKSERLSRQ